MTAKFRFPVLMTFILLLATLLRVWQLGRESFWMDEAYTVVGARLPLLEMLRFIILFDAQPPLDYLIRWAFVAQSPDEFLFRLPSVMFGVLSVAALARLGRDWLGRAGGVVAALLFAVSPFAVWYGREARPYSLFLLTTVAAMWGFWRLFINPAWTTRNVILYISVSLAAYLTHYFGLFAPLAQFTYFLITFRQNYRSLRIWSVFQAIAGSLTLVWIYAQVTSGMQYMHGWLTLPPWYAPLLTFWRFVMGNNNSGYWVGVGWAAVAAIGLWHIRKRKWFALWVIWLVLPPSLLIFVSFKRPVYSDRYLYNVLPAVLLLLAAGLIMLWRWRRIVGLATLTLLVGAMAAGSLTALTTPKEGWRQAADYIEAHEQPGDMLLLRSVYHIGFGIYYQGHLSPSAMDYGWRVPDTSSLAGNRLWLVYFPGNLTNFVRGTTPGPTSFYTAEDPPEFKHWFDELTPYLIEAQGFTGVIVMKYEFPPD